jgi:hypothetical protein
MTRLLTVLCVAVLAVSAATILIPEPAEARSRGVKFFVVKWRLTYERANTVTAEDGSQTTPLELRIRGKASLDGQDFDKDFEMTIKDASPFLEILRTCGMGRLNGVVDDYDTEGRKVIGERLVELNCRAILK